VVWERISGYTTFKKGLVIRVFLDWAKIVDPVVTAMPMLQKLFSVLSFVAVEPFNSCCRKSHD